MLVISCKFAGKKNFQDLLLFIFSADSSGLTYDFIRFPWELSGKNYETTFFAQTNNSSEGQVMGLRTGCQAVGRHILIPSALLGSMPVVRVPAQGSRQLQLKLV